MSADDSSSEQSSRLVYFAAERTLTSWIRTALSLMTLGLVIDRFDLVLRQVVGAGNADVPVRGVWRWSGAIMIGLGIAMAVVSGLYYLRFAVRYRREGTTEVGRSLVVGASFTLVLGVAGLVILGLLTNTLG